MKEDVYPSAEASPSPSSIYLQQLSLSLTLLTLMSKDGTLELERERLREEIEGRKGEEHQHLSMDLNNTLIPLKLEVALLMENPSCMEKVMELKEAWIEER